MGHAGNNAATCAGEDARMTAEYVLHDGLARPPGGRKTRTVCGGPGDGAHRFERGEGTKMHMGGFFSDPLG